MSENYINKKDQNVYYKYNRIRTKLLLFIDNEIQTKIKYNNQNLKFNCTDEIEISFEETFIQKQINNYDLPSSNTIKIKKNDNLDSLSGIDNFSNKINEESYKKERINIHSKTLNKEGNRPNIIFENIICFKKKFYSIKNLSKQSSTFLILPKQKNAAEYLTSLCNSLKKCKNNKITAPHIRSISISTKFINFNKGKKTTKKSNEIKIPKSKKDNNNLYTFSLFRKSQKGNLATNSKKRISGKSTNSIFVTII